MLIAIAAGVLTALLVLATDTSNAKGRRDWWNAR